MNFSERRLLSTRAGVELKDIMEAAYSHKSVQKFEKRSEITKYLIDNIDQYLSNRRRLKSRDSPLQKFKYYVDSFVFGAGIYLGNYLYTTYIVTKIIYIINSSFQFYLMNEFLGKKISEISSTIKEYFGSEKKLLTELESVYFPKVVMCDFRVREASHPNYSHRYSIQCVLPINLYNQQIFTILWFWYLILTIINIIALGKWIKEFVPKHRRSFILKRLLLLNKYQKLLYNKDDPTLKETIKSGLKRFNQNYLKCDGVFIIKMISILTSDVVGTTILLELWNRQNITETKIEPKNSPESVKISEINKNLESKVRKKIFKNRKPKEESETEYDLDSQSEVNSTINSFQGLQIQNSAFMKNKYNSSFLFNQNENLSNRSTKQKKVEFYTPDEHGYDNNVNTRIEDNTNSAASTNAHYSSIDQNDKL